MKRAMTALTILASSVAAPLDAAPPGPPPPAYVSDARELLAATPELSSDKVASLFADDVTASENGMVVATGKAAWLAWRARQAGEYYGTHWGYGEGFGPGYAGGALMIVDSFDDVDPKRPMSGGVLVDRRFQTRSILYRFGEDERIHSVLILRLQAMWRPLPR